METVLGNRTADFCGTTVTHPYGIEQVMGNAVKYPRACADGTFCRIVDLHRHGMDVPILEIAGRDVAPLVGAILPFAVMMVAVFQIENMVHAIVTIGHAVTHKDVFLRFHAFRILKGSQNRRFLRFG